MIIPIDPQGMEGPVCPTPLSHNDRVLLGHGSGGRMTHDLVNNVFIPYLGNPFLLEGNDFARLDLPGDANLSGNLILSTDSHIVNPLFFPGGDIGLLAVCGTVNDICMSGAIPLYLTAGFIIEEGCPVDVLKKVLSSMKKASEESGIMIVAGDTKVVENGKSDKLFINTAGVGWLPTGRQIGGQYAKPGDVVILSGTVGDHGIAVLSAREELGIKADVISDVAPLNHMVAELIKAAPNTHVLRDPTRGGLATTLNEIACQSKCSIVIEENEIPVSPVVQVTCDLFGFDPLYVANEGKLIAIVPESEATMAEKTIRCSPYGHNATRIGLVRENPVGKVLIKTRIGGTRILDMLSGEMLPRIC
jgi:hydrogenase expression/formation protein HypE